MPSIKVKGMTCQHCVASVTKALSEIDGVTDVNVDLESGIASYAEEKTVDIQTVKNAIDRIGFETE